MGMESFETYRSAGDWCLDQAIVYQELEETEKGIEEFCRDSAEGYYQAAMEYYFIAFQVKDEPEPDDYPTLENS